MDNTIRGQGIIDGKVKNQSVIRAEGGLLNLGFQVINDVTGRVEIAANGELLYQNGASSFGDLLIETGGILRSNSSLKDVDLIGPGPLVIQSGTTFFTGSIDNVGATNNGGVITVGSSAGVQSILAYDGLTTLQGGGEVVLTQQNSRFIASGFGQTNDQLINVDNTIRGQGHIQGNVTNQGIIRAEGGTLTISGTVDGQGAVAAVNGAELVYNGSLLKTKTLTIDATSTFAFNGSRLAVTNFIGNFNHTSGTYAPGASPAVSTLTGNYTMSGTSIFELELAGTTTGLFDQLFVSGDVNIINGALSVSLLDGFTVSAGQTFDFLTLDGILTGTFTGLSEGSLVGNFGQDLFITYLAGDGNDIALFSASVVPVPPSVWLMGTGLQGLVGFSPRKSQVVA